MSPLQMFFGPEYVLDVRRDLCAPIGEVLLFKRPKRGVSSPIGVMKAEWGIVVSRGLLETRSYGHRFKFARAVVPPFVMELARGLSSSLVPIVAEREDLPDIEPVLPMLTQPEPVPPPLSVGVPDAVG